LPRIRITGGITLKGLTLARAVATLAVGTPWLRRTGTARLRAYVGGHRSEAAAECRDLPWRATIPKPRRCFR
jgi:hypothetical protein